MSKHNFERIYKNYHSIEFFPHKFTQYLLSPEVGFRKCEVVSVASHPSKGFQRPIHLYTKADDTQEDSSPTQTSAVPQRHAHEAAQRKALERREYERELFPDEPRHVGRRMSSQRSNESLSQYEQLENVYAPSATPCYDTPSHNNYNRTPEPDHYFEDKDSEIVHSRQPEMIAVSARNGDIPAILVNADQLALANVEEHSGEDTYNRLRRSHLPDLLIDVGEALLANSENTNRPYLYPEERLPSNGPYDSTSCNT